MPGKFIPSGIQAFDQRVFLTAPPSFDLFLKSDCIIDIFECGVKNEFMHIVSACKTFDQCIFMLIDTTCEIIGDTCVENFVVPVGENIDIVHGCILPINADKILRLRTAYFAQDDKVKMSHGYLTEEPDLPECCHPERVEGSFHQVFIPLHYDFIIPPRGRGVNKKAAGRGDDIANFAFSVVY